MKKMYILKKVKDKDATRHIFFCGIKLFSYKKKKKLSEFDKIYAKRFKGLTEQEARFILESQFKMRVGYELNLDKPKTFNEKLNYLKLYYRDPLMTKCADKIGVREYIKEKIGEQYLVPSIGIYNSVDEIDFDALPNKFVMKVNWGSGQNIIVADKSKINIKQKKQQLVEWMRQENNNYYGSLEWVYKDIKPKIIVEPYIEQMDGKLLDYKFFCFAGKVFCVQIDVDRYTSHSRCFYDINFTKMPFSLYYPEYKKEIIKPINFEKMKELAEKLSTDFPFVRVDFYNIDGAIKFGEMTFYPGAGYEPFNPIEWDYKLGEMLNLPQKEKL